VRKGLCLVAASLFIVSGPAAIAAAPAHPVIRASQAKITLNGYPVWTRPPAWVSPTYAGAIKAFGAPDSCRLGYPAGGIPHLSNFSTVKWRELGLTMAFGSYGSSRRGGDACSEPGSFYLDNVRITGSTWTTGLGLKIGDPVSTLKRLYPTALPHNDSWWIVIAQNKVASTHLFPVFSATVVRGKIAAFVFQIGAEGD
jgi:hypothetical protein